MPSRPTLYGRSPWKIASSVNASATCCGSCASMPAFHWSKTARRASVSCTLTTIHVQDLAGDEGRVLEIHYRVHDIVDLADTPNRMQLRQRVVRGGVVHRGADHAERDRVRADTAPRVLDGQRLGHCVQPTLGQRRQRGRHL